MEIFLDKTIFISYKPLVFPYKYCGGKFMLSIRISKYNPQRRDENGRYGETTWTSFSDIGNFFGEHLFTYEEYIQYENKYIYVLTSLYKLSPNNYFIIKNLELYHKDTDCEFIEGMKIYNTSVFDSLIRNILREHLWCKLYNDYLEIHFGYDYYVYVIFKQDMNRKDIEDFCQAIFIQGLFVEEMLSPYSKIKDS